MISKRKKDFYKYIIRSIKGIVFLLFLLTNAYLEVNPLHLILQTNSQFISYIDKETLYNNQENLRLVIITFLLMTFVCDSGVTL